MCNFIFKLLCPGTRLKVKMGMKKNKMFSPIMTHFVAKAAVSPQRSVWKTLFIQTFRMSYF